jgi:predicted PurR-regulated permease PerM
MPTEAPVVSWGPLLNYGVVGLIAALGLFLAWRVISYLVQQNTKLVERYEENLQGIVNQNQVVIENNTKAMLELKSNVHELSGRVESVEEALNRVVPGAWDGKTERRNGGH